MLTLKLIILKILATTKTITTIILLTNSKVSHNLTNKNKYKFHMIIIDR